MKKNTLFCFILTAAFLVLVFRNWIASPQIVGGDWPYFYEENIKAFSILPPAWSSVHGNGLGGPLLAYPLDSYLYFTGWLFSNILHIPWAILYKFIWFGMFLFLGGFSIYRLLRQILPKVPFAYAFLGVIIHLTNTYILLVVGGGQMGVALGYAIAPLVLTKFISLTNALVKNSKVYSLSLTAGLVFSLQVLFDFRIAYITLFAVLIYVLSILISQSMKKTRVIILLLIYVFFIPLTITSLLHAYWVLPLLFTSQSSLAQLGAGYTSVEALRFFSFAKFENTIGLLHPNWPENIFGKVGFMKAEFIFLPIIAYASLLFIKIKEQKEKIYILYFALLGLVCAFLAKGTNDPFGNFYAWLFVHFPGFNMFRDSTKWYTLVAISYSVLIPYSVSRIYNWIKFQSRLSLSNYKFAKSKVFNFQNFFIFFVISIALFLIHPALFGQLGGTFKNHEMPAEYIQLKNMLLKDKEFSRTMWIPRMQRFGFTNQNHPATEAPLLLNTSSSVGMIKELNKEDSQKTLSELSIKYIIIPYDSEKEIFLKDRIYNDLERIYLKNELDKIKWLQQDTSFTDIMVYKNNKFYSHIWLKGKDAVSYDKISNTKYNIKLTKDISGRLVFNETYNPYWHLKTRNQTINSERYGNINSFDLSKIKVDTNMELVYKLENMFYAGRAISAITILCILGYLLYLNKKTL